MTKSQVVLVKSCRAWGIKALNTKAEKLLDQVLPDHDFLKPIPIDRLIEGELSEVLEFCFELSDTGKNVEGAAFIDLFGSKKICVKEKVFDSAISGHSHSRFTLAHEMSHIYLKHFEGEKVVGNLRASKKDVHITCDPEWQADTLAGAFLASYKYLVQLKDHCGRLLTKSDLMKHYNLSYDSARIRLQQVHSKIDDSIWCESDRGGGQYYNI